MSTVYTFTLQFSAAQLFDILDLSLKNSSLEIMRLGLSLDQAMSMIKTGIANNAKAYDSDHVHAAIVDHCLSGFTKRQNFLPNESRIVAAINDQYRDQVFTLYNKAIQRDQNWDGSAYAVAINLDANQVYTAIRESLNFSYLGLVKETQETGAVRSIAVERFRHYSQKLAAKGMLKARIHQWIETYVLDGYLINQPPTSRTTHQQNRLVVAQKFLDQTTQEYFDLVLGVPGLI